METRKKVGKRHCKQMREREGESGGEREREGDRYI
jgi:hypothetical protein